MTLIYIFLFFCHFLGDFTWLSTKWMLLAKKIGYPLFPIFCHGFVHGLLMSIALVFFKYDFETCLMFGSFQSLFHSLIDIGKGRINFFFEKTRDTNNVLFWIVFGIDQYLHILTIFYLVYLFL